jgi:polysaccharide deacetylase 2 family uncharacterized protein YibQ
MGAFALFILAFGLWALTASDPLGGEPKIAAAIDPASQTTAPAPDKAGIGPNRYDGPDAAQTPNNAATMAPTPATALPAGSRTVTIIDGTSGKRQDVVIPGEADLKKAPVDQRLLENSRHGPIPKVAQDGTRPADSYARPLKAAAGTPRVAIVIGGLGTGVTGTMEAIARLPAPLTLAFTPYGADIANFVAHARNNNHEVLLQVPMEPLDYPDNDPGPQTLLTSLGGEQNVDRLHWLFSRFQGYIGITSFMGARFTASEHAMAPVLREVARRGLVYFDDGTSARSIAAQIAGANNLPFAKADMVIDAVPAPGEIDKVLARLEGVARDRGSAIGYGSALPVTIERIAKWSKAAQARGIALVPLSAVAAKARSGS